MRFNLSNLAAVIAALGSASAASPGPAIEMNWFDDKKCSASNSYEPSYVYGNMSCIPLNYAALLTNYYNDSCDLILFRGKACNNTHGWTLDKAGDYCVDLTSFGSYEAQCDV